MRDGDARAFLADIIESADRARTYAQGMGYQDFLRDIKTQDAIILVVRAPSPVRVSAKVSAAAFFCLLTGSAGVPPALFCLG